MKLKLFPLLFLFPSKNLHPIIANEYALCIDSDSSCSQLELSDTFCVEKSSEKSVKKTIIMYAEGVLCCDSSREDISFSTVMTYAYILALIGTQYLCPFAYYGAVAFVVTDMCI